MERVIPRACRTMTWSAASLTLALSLIALSESLTLAAQPVATAITYQGQLVKNGQPVTAVCDFQFALWDSSTGGTPAGDTVTLNQLPIAAGIFTAQLDFGAGAFAGEARWISTSVRCAGDAAPVPLGPRQAVTAAPYAFALPPGTALAGALDGSPGVLAPILALSNSGSGEGLSSIGGSAGVIGSGRDGPGIIGVTSKDNGVVGYANGGVGNAGVYGKATINGPSGVIGTALDGYGVWGVSESGLGVYGRGNGHAIGVRGDSELGVGVRGAVINGGGTGVQGTVIGNGTGVLGESEDGLGVHGTSEKSVGVLGESSGLDGVKGISHHPLYSGVSAFNDAGGPALYAGAKTTQAREAGGWVKAMALVNENGSIARCYSGVSGRSDGNCGFLVDHTSPDGFPGFYAIDFGFRVDDRFLLISSMLNSASLFTDAYVAGSSGNSVAVNTRVISSGFNKRIDAPFTIFVF